MTLKKNGYFSVVPMLSQKALKLRTTKLIMYTTDCSPHGSEFQIITRQSFLSCPAQDPLQRDLQSAPICERDPVLGRGLMVNCITCEIHIITDFNLVAECGPGVKKEWGEIQLNR